MVTVDRDQFMRDGFLILRGFVLSDEVRQLRGTWETLLERQKEIWRSQRGPDDPPGGEWDSSLQPRPQLLSSNDQAGVNLLDGDTISALEFWTSDRIRGVAGELLSVADAASGQICLMCNPTFDYGPAFWHRDWHPIDMGPMRHAQEAVVEHGPTIVQWNVPLYDDSVFWVVPKSHDRLNTDAEDRQLREDSRVPLPGGVPVDLKAGDAIVYNNHLLHWGSDYSTRAIRRTMHASHSIFPTWEWSDLIFLKFLDEKPCRLLEGWARRTEDLKATTENCLRAVLARDGQRYMEGLDSLHPTAGPKGKLQLTIWLCKAAMMIHLLKRMDYHQLSWDFRRRAEGKHGVSLNWGPAFAERFTKDEADTIWRNFGPVEERLKAAGGEDYVPGYQSGPIPYYLDAMVNPITVDEFMAKWGEK